MSRITISYRRQDSDAITGRIFDRLVARYGKDSVFRDIDNIPFGTDFRKHIDTALRQSDVLIVVVGPAWVGPSASGKSRIEDANDPVRIEVELALQRDMAIIPVLVGGAAMPPLDQLPDSIKDLAFRNAPKVDAGQDFDYHIQRLTERINEILGDHAPPTLIGPITSVTTAPAGQAMSLRIVGAALVIAGGIRLILTLIFLVANFPFAENLHLVWAIWFAALAAAMIVIGVATLVHAYWAPIVGMVVCLIAAFNDLWLLGHGISAADLPMSRLVIVPLPVYLLVAIASILVYLRNPDLERAAA